jgi:hypothetical protein
MVSTLLLFALASAAALYWFAAADARDRARAHANAACARAGVQLLDGSVVLRRLRLRRGPDGLRFERRFAYEYCPDGASRLPGWVDLAGREVVGATVPAAHGPGGPI